MKERPGKLKFGNFMILVNKRDLTKLVRKFVNLRLCFGVPKVVKSRFSKDTALKRSYKAKDASTAKISPPKCKEISNILLSGKIVGTNM